MMTCPACGSERPDVCELLGHTYPVTPISPAVSREAPLHPHPCHAFGCTRNISPKLLMCLKHWKLVPREIQSRVWRNYRPGQEIDKQPSPAYILVQRAAVWAVFVAEGGCAWPDVPEVGSREYSLGPKVLGNKQMSLRAPGASA